MLEQFEVYINAQKAIAVYLMGSGILMLLLALLFYFAGSNAVFNGLKIGMLCVGFLSLIGGYGYRKTEENLLKEQTKLFEQNPTEFRQAEKERMGKVMKTFPIYQLVFGAIAFLLLVYILLTSNQFVHGILFSVMLYMMSNLIIEQVSKTSIESYFQQLSN